MMDNNKIDMKKAAMTGLAYASGWRLAQQAGSAIVEVWRAGGRVFELCKSAIFRPKARVETFGQAVARLGLSETDIAARISEFRQRAAWWFLGLATTFSFLILAPVMSPENLASHVMLAVGGMVWTSSRALVWQFRAGQAKRRELISFWQWVVGEVWLHRAVAALGFVLLAALALFATAANAADAAMPLRAFTPAPGDAAVNVLREMFGPVVDHVSNSGGIDQQNADSLMNRMMGPFNSAALFLGMLFVGYVSIKGVVDSAHDGEVLGKKMSEIWVPIRTVGGSALVLPAFGGFCLAQLIILWVLVQSIGIANTIMSAAFDYITDTKMVMRPHLPESRPLAANILKSEVCRAALNTHYSYFSPMRIEMRENPRTKVNTGEIVTTNGMIDNALPVIGIFNQLSQLSNSVYTVVNFEWRAEANGAGSNYINPVVCGAVHWEESEESSESNGNIKIAKKPIMQAHMSAVRTMIQDLRPVAERIARGDIPPLGALENAAAKYENSVATAAKVAVEQTSDKAMDNFVKFAKEGGWIFLPAYYNQLITLNDTLQSAINTLPSSTAADIEFKDVFLQNVEMAMHSAEEYIKARPSAQQLAAAADLAGSVAGYGERRDLAPLRAYMAASDEDWKIPRNWEDAKRIFSKPALGAMRQVTQEIAGSNLSHVGQIKAVGDTIIASGELILSSMFMISGFANANPVKLTIGNVFDAGAAFGMIGGVLSTIVMLLFFFGAVAAFWIPMIPFIAGASAIIKWVVMAFEAVVSAPIFAVAHIHPEGHDVAGKAAAGYMHYLNVALRPALIVIGFFGSIILAQPITHLFNLMFMTAVAGAEYKSLSGLIAFLAYTGIYIILMTSVIHSVFTLVNWLPDNLMRVIGGAVGVHGVNDRTQDDAEGAVKGALVNIRHGAGAGHRKPEGKGGDNDQQEKNKYADGPDNKELLG